MVGLSSIRSSRSWDFPGFGGRCSFPLAELVVFVAGAAVIMMILSRLSTISRAITRSEGCQQNLQQIGSAMLAYTRDYNDKLPPCAQGNYPAGWAGEILPYLNGPAVFKCPEDPTTALLNSRLVQYPLSYVMNKNLVAAGRKQKLIHGLPFCQIPFPGLTVMCAETLESTCILLSPGRTEEASHSDFVAAGANETPARHSQLHTDQFLACDGHVETLAAHQVSFGIEAAHTGDPGDVTAGDYIYDPGIFSHAASTSSMLDSNDQPVVLTFSKR